MYTRAEATLSRSSPRRPAVLLGTALLVISALVSKAADEQVIDDHAPGGGFDRRRLAVLLGCPSFQYLLHRRPARHSPLPLFPRRLRRLRRSWTSSSSPASRAAFNDMVAGVFDSPDSAGGIEFEFDGDPGQLVVTSRLYSTEPEPTVGMFIPGLQGSGGAQPDRPELDPERRRPSGIPRPTSAYSTRATVPST